MRQYKFGKQNFMAQNGRNMIIVTNGLADIDESNKELMQLVKKFNGRPADQPPPKRKRKRNRAKAKGEK